MLLKALLLEKASGWVAWIVKEHHLWSDMLRKRPGKKLSQPRYGSDAKVYSKTELNKLCNLFLLLTDSCSLGVTILTLSLDLLCSISTSSFFILKVTGVEREVHGVPYIPGCLGVEEMQTVETI